MCIRDRFTTVHADRVCICFRVAAMASRLFSTVGKIGIGLAIAGSVVNTALYNGKSACYC